MEYVSLHLIIEDTYLFLLQMHKMFHGRMHKKWMVSPLERRTSLPVWDEEGKLACHFYPLFKRNEVELARIKQISGTDRDQFLILRGKK